MISQTAEYALRAVVTLARGDGRPMTVGEIADRTKIPPTYLSKVLQALARAKLVQSQRGLHGGFGLLRAPEDLSVLDVVSAVDPVQRIHACPLDLPEHAHALCPLHRRLDQAAALVENAFRESCIADLRLELEAHDGAQGRAPRPLPMAQPPRVGKPPKAPGPPKPAKPPKAGKKGRGGTRA